MLAPRLGVERPEIGHLRLAEDLQPLGGKALDVAGEREPRARDVRARDDTVETVGAGHALQLEQLTELLEERARLQLAVRR